LHLKPLGTIGGFQVDKVDGSRIRDLLDVDFTSGGSAGRYRYIPEGHIWIDDGLTPEDVAPTIVHEIVEYSLMQEGASYSDAHDMAAEVEMDMRSGRNGGPPIQEAKEFLDNL
jgi:hypothetical protein